MHPSILAQRRALAIDRIVQAVTRLDPERADALRPKGIKDASTADMMFLENVADLVDQLVPKAQIDETGVTAVTDPHPVDEPADDPRPTLDDFPAHVVEAPTEEKEPTPKKPARKTSKRSKT